MIRAAMTRCYVFLATVAMAGQHTDLGVVHIVDDDQSFRTSTARLLAAAGFEVAQYASASAFLQQLSAAKAGCILLDVQMPSLNGLELQCELAKLALNWPVVFITGHGDISTSVRAMKAGADDFLPKPVSPELLIETLERTLREHATRHREEEARHSLKARVATLTAREHQVFALMVKGVMNKQIAHQLGTSIRTIKAHRHAIMEKLEAQSFAEAVLIAERLGLLASECGDAALTEG